jgi:hypothetical protein
LRPASSASPDSSLFPPTTKPRAVEPEISDQQTCHEVRHPTQSGWLDAATKFLSFPPSRAMAMALFPFKNPITDATGCLGGPRSTSAQGLASGILPKSDAPSASPTRGTIAPNWLRIGPKIAFPSSFRHEHCVILAAPFGMGSATVRSFQVSLVEPVAYQFQLASPEVIGQPLIVKSP